MNGVSKVFSKEISGRLPERKGIHGEISKFKEGFKKEFSNLFFWKILENLIVNYEVNYAFSKGTLRDISECTPCRIS